MLLKILFSCNRKYLPTSVHGIFRARLTFDLVSNSQSTDLAAISWRPSECGLFVLLLPLFASRMQ